jgi:hypothetical protein
LSILGKVHCKLRLDKYTWIFPFLVSDNLSCPVILGSDFLGKTGLLLDLRTRVIYFPFDSANKLALCTEHHHAPLAAVFDGDNLSEHLIEDSLPDLGHLSQVQAEAVRQLVSDFPQVFTSKLGSTNLVEYDIELSDSNPVKSPPYRLSPPKMLVLREQIQDMLDKGIIRHSVSPYSSPIFLVPTGETEYRPVVDYRGINN